MYSISIKHSPPSTFTSHIANLQYGKIKDNNLMMSPNVANGYVKAFAFQNGIECLISDYKLKEDLHLNKLPLIQKFFILRIDEVSHADNPVVMVNRKYKNEFNRKKYSLVFLSSMEQFTFVASEKSHVKTLEIFLPRQWLYNKIGMQNADEMLTTYLDIKNRKSEVGLPIPSFTRQFNSIVSAVNDGQDNKVSFEKNIDVLLNKFTANLISRLQELDNEKKIKIVNEEISRLLDVKNYLLQDLSKPPPFSFLISIAAMSSTSLKTKFKKMYGVNIYEYFQKMRMEKARILLLSLHYSVKDVGHQVGYINLSNFSIAFKKEFDCLPGKFVQLHKDLSFVK